MRKVSLTPERQAMYKAVKEKAQQIIDICDGILISGKTEAQSCKDAGRTNVDFRYICQMILKEKPELRHIFKETDWAMGWREEFLYMLTLEHIPAPDNFDEIYKDVCAKALTPRQIEVLNLRMDGVSLQEIGNQFNVGQERIRQVEAKSLRILRRPEYRYRLAYGNEYYNVLLERNDARDQYDRVYLDAEAAEKVKQDNKAKADMEEMKAETKSFKKVAESIVDSMKDLSPVELSMTKARLEDLGLSTRAYNCLRRHFTKSTITAYDISRLSYEELLAVRNMGRRSVEEITSCFYEKFGFEFV